MKFSRRRFTASLAAALVAVSLAAAAAPLAKTRLRAGAHAFDAEVAATPAQRKQGLTGRTRLDDGAGMLFVFPRKARHCFWMKDTPLPLSIAFLADDGTVVSLADMQPQTADLHCAPTPVRYTLEVRRGNFRRHGIRPGMRLSGGPFDPDR